MAIFGKRRGQKEGTTETSGKSPAPDAIKAILSEFQHPAHSKKLPDSGAVASLFADDAGIRIILDMQLELDETRDTAFAKAVEQRLTEAFPDHPARVAVTGERRPTKAAPRPANPQAKPGPGPRQNEGALQGIRDVKHVIAVASGKGGVGKSTTSVNLAVALAALGQRVGLLDADIYGPSIPLMMGTQGTRPKSQNKRWSPIMAHGLSTMSIGSLTDPDTAMIWRGPMATGALLQMMRDVDWGALDVLVVDMPPGTGDIQLSLAQRAPLAGAVVVSTPQDLALIDVKKAIAMFGQVSVPILGMIENMSTFICPHCGEPSAIFGEGGAIAAAKDLDIDVLGAIPLTMALRETSDAGTPLLAGDTNGPVAQAYLTAAAALLDAIPGAQQTPPTIRFE
ncbi:MAG: Mrp/NBP35 family ATP-binding protein [Pseudomonadota bacterium]